MRRVIDTAGSPGSSGFKVVSRAIRGFMSQGDEGFECFNIKSAASDILRLRAELPPHVEPCCRKCGTALSELSIIVGDADQAYEQCTTAAVSDAWRYVSQKVLESVPLASC